MNETEHPLLTARLQWELDHPRPESLRKAEQLVVRGLKQAGFGNQYQVTRRDGFEIAVDDIIVSVRMNPEP
jgi:hypothetical protein